MNRQRSIQLDAPNVGELEKKYLCDCIDSGYVSTFGPFVTEFEDKLKDHIYSPYAVAIQSGTTGIEMALRACGVKAGDEVIVPVMTFAATINPVIHMGAVPVLVDVEEDTWNISAVEIKKAITKKTKAVIVVHLYGNPCDMGPITELCKENGIFLIEDATESLGAKYKELYTGAIGDYGVLSFNGNKIITTGGGGMVFCKKEETAKNIRYLTNQAKGMPEFEDYLLPGFNYRMTNLEASIGLAQFERLNFFLEHKRETRKIYESKLDNQKIVLQKEQENAISSWWFSSAIFKGSNILEMQEKLKQKNIPTRRLFAPLVEYKAYKKYTGKNKFENAYDIYKYGLNLPSATSNSVEDIEYVCDEINK